MTRSFSIVIFRFRLVLVIICWYRLSNKVDNYLYFLHIYIYINKHVPKNQFYKDNLKLIWMYLRILIVKVVVGRLTIVLIVEIIIIWSGGLIILVVEIIVVRSWWLTILIVEVIIVWSGRLAVLIVVLIVEIIVIRRSWWLIVRWNSAANSPWSSILVHHAGLNEKYKVCY